MGIQVTKTESGWQITKDGNTFTITDKNKNGRWDGDELAKSLSGSGYLNADETYEFQYKIAQMSGGVTAEEMAQYAAYQEAKKAAQEKKERIEEYKLQAFEQTRPKKTSVWQKIAMGSMIALPVLSGLSTLFSAWSYNNGNYNDTALRVTGAATNTMFSLSAVLPMLSAMNGTNMFASTNNYNPMYNINFDKVIADQDAYINNMAATYSKALGGTSTSENNADAVKEKQQAANRTAVEAAYKKLMETSKGKLFLDESNKEYISEMYFDKEEYTEEEMQNIDNIRQAASVPYRHITNDEADKTKLTLKYSVALHELLKNYEEANEAKKPDIISDANYTSIKAMLAKETLTEAEIEKLKEIIKKPI